MDVSEYLRNYMRLDYNLARHKILCKSSLPFPVFPRLHEFPEFLGYHATKSSG